MKILVIGQARHGKDTVAELIAEKTGMAFKSSSLAALEIFLFDELNRLRQWDGLKPYANHEEAYADRVNLRQLWYDLIADYNKLDAARLTKDILAKHDIYVGMRNIRELKATRHLFDWIIWIDAYERLGNTEGPESLTLTEADADYCIDNSRDLDWLNFCIDNFLKCANNSTRLPRLAK